ncbi:MAG: DUF1638 domain-containing protein [Deltaproteobacteria bacterium]|jgi:hypothetical protein|nr:DUF1638 domain-containing protein [Deltaproteobacteria bacterium]
MRERRVLIACGIFDEELGTALAPLAGRYEAEIIRLPPGYHCEIEALEARLREALADPRAADRSRVRVLFGRRCLPDMEALCRGEGVRCLPTANCLSAMAGDERVRGLEADGRTMVVTPAWIRKLFLAPDGIPAHLRWDPADFRVNFGRYDRVLVLDTGLPPTDGEVIECFDLFGNPVIETEPCGAERFNGLVEDLLAG